jgi:capsular exopolysaccharide synthesis family protein
MSRIFEALQQVVQQTGTPGAANGSRTTIPAALAHMGEALLPLDAVPTFSIPASPDKRLIAITDRFSIGAEKLRILSTRLKYLRHRHSIKKLLITSTIRGEGKTTIAANLCIVLAQQRQKTLLIDGDLHQPALTELLGITGRPGLGDWWGQQQRDVIEFFCRAEGLPLWFLPSGGQVEQPLTMLHSPAVAQLMGGIEGSFDWVIIDSPPLAPLADARTWCTLADSILLIARQGITPKKLLEETVTCIEKSKVLGILLNAADSREHQYYLDYYKHSGKHVVPGPSTNATVSTPS